MGVELVSEEDDLVGLGEFLDGLLSKDQKIFFLSRGVDALMNDLIRGDIQGSDEGGRPVSFVLKLLAFKGFSTLGAATFEALNRLNSRLFIHANEVKIGFGLILIYAQNHQDQLTDQFDFLTESLPAGDLRKEPVLILVRTQGLSFLKALRRSGHRGD